MRSIAYGNFKGDLPNNKYGHQRRLPLSSHGEAKDINNKYLIVTTAKLLNSYEDL